MSELWYFECPECGYDSDEAGRLVRGTSSICPICAGDTGRDVYLKFRPATAAEMTESTGTQPARPRPTDSGSPEDEHTNEGG